MTSGATEWITHLSLLTPQESAESCIKDVFAVLADELGEDVAEKLRQGKLSATVTKSVETVHSRFRSKAPTATKGVLKQPSKVVKPAVKAKEAESDA